MKKLAGKLLNIVPHNLDYRGTGSIRLLKPWDGRLWLQTTGEISLVASNLNRSLLTH